jgi:predicted nucleic acid-binding protein
MEKILIPSVVLEEFVLVLNKLKIERKIIGAKIKEILENEKIKIIPIESIDIFNANSTILSEKISFKRFNDKIILSIAKKNKIALFTFDSELRRESKKYNIRLI